MKAPRPGTVKTRLAAAIGPSAALAAYAHLVETLLERLRPLPLVQLQFSPDEALPEISPWLQPGWQARPQGPGNLGQRLHAAFAAAFASGFAKVVVVGSDCPSAGPQDLADAERALADGDVVIGPAEDGGYWLIGLKEPRPELFENVPWSSDKVLNTTLQTASTLGLRTTLLRTLRDIDTADDWIAYSKERATTQTN